MQGHGNHRRKKKCMEREFLPEPSSYFGNDVDEAKKKKKSKQSKKKKKERLCIFTKFFWLTLEW